MKSLATSLLLLTCIVFLLAANYEHTHWLVPWIKAFSEAAMVGAFADWFAVTALFRRPLGLPIPHTAVIPNNKERIGKELGEFINQNFLSHEVLAARLVQLKFSDKISIWLNHKDSADKIAARVGSFAIETLKLFDDRSIRKLFEDNLVSFLKGINVSVNAGNLLELIFSGPYRDQLMDLGIAQVKIALDKHSSIITKFIKKELPWWVPGFVHDKIFDQVFSGLHNTFQEMQEDKEHELRKRMSDGLTSFIQSLKTDSQYISYAEELKTELMSSEFGKKYFENLAFRFKDGLLNAVAEPTSALRKNMRQILELTGKTLADSKEVRDRIDAWFVKIGLDVVLSYKGEFSSLISDTMKQWNAKTISDKIESQVGKDLQFIRINGTLVGGLIGLVIHFVSKFLANY